jgi:hypothetical protein
MEEPQAIHHLKTACVPAPGTTDAALRAEWLAAKANLGAPIAGSGNPGLQQIPNSHDAYAAALLALPWVAGAFQGHGVTPANVQMVEIDLLLAYQFTVDIARSDHHCGGLASPPTVDEMFATCLPTAQPQENFNFARLGQSAIIKSRSLNLRVQAEGIVNNMIAGIFFGPALPLVQVTRLNGRCYLHNGFHRALGLRRRGATHMPCILRDVADPESAGIRKDGVTFSEALLASADPPTIAHFAQGRAHAVQLRATSRILHVSWADYVWPEE